MQNMITLAKTAHEACNLPKCGSFALFLMPALRLDVAGAEQASRGLGTSPAARLATRQVRRTTQAPSPNCGSFWAFDCAQ